MTRFILDLALVLLGAGIAFASSMGMQAILHNREKKEKRIYAKRLALTICNEVEQIAEQLDVDMRYENISKPGLTKERMIRKLKELELYRNFFDAHKSELLILSDYNPNAIVKFYVRLNFYIQDMGIAAHKSDYTMWERVREQALFEAENLKLSLREEIAQA